jgi:hypothetical protein
MAVYAKVTQHITKLPVLARFVGEAAAAPTKRARTGNFVICWVTLAYTAVRRKVSAVC